MCKYTPIQMARSMHYGNNYYITFSLKLGRNVQLFSKLEYENFLTLEMDSEVLSYCEQPLMIKVEIDKKIETSIFDMWVLHKNGLEEFQEVKYLKDIEKNSKDYKRVAQQIYTQENWCKLHGYKYTVRTEYEINSGPYFTTNLRYLNGAIKRQQIELCKRYLNDITYLLMETRMRVYDLVHKNLIPNNEIFPTIALGIYEGVISANIANSIIGYDTEIWLNHQSNKYPIIES